MDRRTFAKSLAGLGAAPFVVNAASAATEGGNNMLELMGGSITDVPGIKLGHHTLTKRPTGCTVLLCEEGATAGVDVRGSAPGTRETDLLDPINFVQQVQAILLSGGSAYGLAAATGVMRYLEENNLGFKIGKGVVPIVPAAILMDLGVGDFPFDRMRKRVISPAKPRRPNRRAKAMSAQARAPPSARCSGWTMR